MRSTPGWIAVVLGIVFAGVRVAIHDRDEIGFGVARRAEPETGGREVRRAAHQGDVGVAAHMDHLRVPCAPFVKALQQPLILHELMCCSRDSTW
jgi:hypothetical protein